MVVLVTTKIEKDRIKNAAKVALTLNIDFSNTKGQLTS